MNWLKFHFKLPYILLLAVMFFLAYFGISDLRNNRVKHNVLQQYRVINEYGIRAARLVHQIQIERGLTAVAFSKGETTDNEQLQQHRSKVDGYIETLVSGEGQSKDFTPTILSKVLYIEAKQAIAHLRKQINQGNQSVEDIILGYSNINKALLDTIRRAVADTPANQHDKMSTFYYLLQSIENAGIERAIVTGAIATGAISAEKQRTLWRAIENQYTYLDLYSMTADDLYRNKLQQAQQSEIFAKVTDAERKLLDGSLSMTPIDKSEGEITANQWWNMVTEKMNLLHGISLDISTQLSRENETLIRYNNRDFYRKGVVYSLAGLLILGLLWLWISARLRSEKLQDESRQRQNLALEGSGTAVWDYDVKADQLFLSAQWLHLLGIEGDTKIFTRAQLQAQTEMPGLSQLDEILNCHLEKLMEDYVGDHLIIAAQGNEVWVNTCSRVATLDDRGNPSVIVGTFTDISDRKMLEDHLRTSQQRLQFHLDNSPLAVVEFNSQFEIAFWNRAAEKMFGYSAEEALGKGFALIVPQSTQESMENMCREVLSGTAGKTVTLLNQAQDGRPLQCQWNNTPLISQSGRINGFAAIVEDITEQRQAALRQHRSQKMEALGSLTGGIAHDYNNVLGVILGYAEILQARLESTPELLRYAQQIYHAGERGAKLAGNLLKFSKQQPKSQSIENLNLLLTNDKDMLNQTLTVSVDLNLQLDEHLWSVKIDAGGFEDMLFNLCINAKHAMPEGGKLTITSCNCEMDEALAEQLNLPAGDYVSLAVEDTGCGMNEDTLQRIFDPYFSTKGNKGTGLGLSQVYGFIQACGGVIDVFSQPGLGTRFVIYFPRHHDEVRYTVQTTKPVSQTKGNETILVVDDEASLCELVCLILQKNGYRTIPAADAEQALMILQREPVDLMLSDVIMPKMNGFQLAEKVSTEYPQVQIRLASGYHDEEKVGKTPYKPEYPVLSKPYDTDELLLSIREQLDRAHLVHEKELNAEVSDEEQPDELTIEAEQSAICWTDKMSIDGGGELDRDHQILLSLLNKCRLMANGEMDYSTLPEVIDELQSYTRYHFRREEMVMKRCNYPKYNEHCKIHNMLITKMQTIVESNNDRQIVQWLSNFLSQWLIEHIMVMDKAFVSYIEQYSSEVQQALKSFDEDEVVQ